MIQLNLGDTPHLLAQDDFDRLGLATEGMSGSDLSVVVREALMEPLRQCQLAKQFLPCVVEGQEKLRPCVAYPNCFRCPMELCGGGTQAQAPCTACGARRMSLYDVPSEQLLVPDVSADDFLHILTKVKGSVATEELNRFVEWTESFGQDG